MFEPFLGWQRSACQRNLFDFSVLFTFPRHFDNHPMQNNTITFSTSDDPPQLLTISRSSLVAGSTVFRDMLSLPSQDSSSPIPLTETAKELKPLLLALEGDEDAFKKVMQNAWSSRRDWQTFAVLADKYDIASARRRIETQIW